MRLLQLDQHGQLSLTQHCGPNIPPYAILSHTWGDDDDEVTFDDVKRKLGKSKVGYIKLQFCGNQARKDKINHFWVDTCCINKADHAELSEAITSMFRWYRDAVKCYVYLSDVPTRTGDDTDESEQAWQSAIRDSRWFTRGWTLQELLAPQCVEFFSRDIKLLGDKKTLEELIHEVTDIPITALQGSSLSEFPVAERLRWAAKRETKKKEDMAYCLLGIFNVFMPLIYGEEDHAFIRLIEEIEKRYGRESTVFLSPSMGNLASTYQNQARWTEAGKLKVQVMKTRKMALGDEHPSTLTSVANVASTYRNQGRWTEAEKMEVQVMETMKRVLGELSRCESSICTISQLSQQHQLLEPRKQMNGIDLTVSKVLSELKSVFQHYEQNRGVAPHSARFFSDKSPFSIHSSPILRQAKSWHTGQKHIWHLCGITGTIVRTTAPHNRIYISSIRVCVGRVSIKVDLTLCITLWNWLSSISFDGSRISVKHFVHPKSDLMVASSKGDVNRMRTVLEARKGSPFDFTNDGVTPLLLAIESGCLSAVELLLQSGADVNDTFGLYQTSALSWALKHRQLEICRLVIRYRASFHHLSTWGWSPMFYLWPGPERQPPAIEFIEILRANEVEFPLLHAGLLDTESWSLMHRAAIHSMPDDLLMLINSGLDPYLRLELGWMPIHDAVFHGVYDNFLTLLPYYEEKFGIEIQDYRGWTLLHIATGGGHGRIIRKLLALGANWLALTNPTFDFVPSEIEGISCTPAKVAFAYSDEHYVIFKDAVRDVLGEEVPDVETWCDALEEIAV